MSLPEKQPQGRHIFRLVRTSALASAILLAACETEPPVVRPQPRPLGRDLVMPPSLEKAPPSTSDDKNVALQSFEAPAGELTLQRALAQALVGSPELAAFSYDIRAAEARTMQAEFIPNPVVGVDSQDFGGSGTRRGFDGAQTTLSFNQLIELGSKREKRVRSARLDESLAAWDYETKRLDTLLETTRAFIGLLTAQRKLELAESILALDRQVHTTVDERVRAGRVSPLEERRAQVALANATVSVDRARREVTAARDRLTMQWGGKTANFDRAIGNLAEVSAPRPLAELLSLAAQNPDLARWATEVDSREAKVSVERSKDIPDPTLSAGVRRYGEDRSNAFIAGISIPIPVFGLNRGNVLDAQERLAKGRAEQRAAEARITAAVRQGFEKLSSAFEEVNSLNRDILPAATTAFEGAGEGYRRGKFALIDVLDSQRSLTEAQGRLVDAMAEYQIARAEMERLTGQSMTSPHQPTQARTGEK